MPLIFIACLLTIQSLLYVTTQKLGGSLRMPLILGACLLTNFWLLPELAIQTMVPPEVSCGNAALGITLAFWMVGTPLISLCHGLFYFLKRRSEKAEQASQAHT